MVLSAFLAPKIIIKITALYCVVNCRWVYLLGEMNGQVVKHDVQHLLSVGSSQYLKKDDETLGVD